MQQQSAAFICSSMMRRQDDAATLFEDDVVLSAISARRRLTMHRFHSNTVSRRFLGDALEILVTTWPANALSRSAEARDDLRELDVIFLRRL